MHVAKRTPGVLELHLVSIVEDFILVLMLPVVSMNFAKVSEGLLLGLHVSKFIHFAFLGSLNNF